MTFWNVFAGVDSDVVIYFPPMWVVLDTRFDCLFVGDVYALRINLLGNSLAAMMLL